MNKFENTLRNISKKDFDVPKKYQDSVQDALDYVSNMQNIPAKKKNIITEILRKIIALIIFGALGTVAYAGAGGTIEGMPVMDWLGVKFSNAKIEEYKQNIEGQIIKYDNTSVELTSTLCSEGITILEFDVKLSEEDYNKLKINQSVLSDEYLNAQEEYKKGLKEQVIRELKQKLYNDEFIKGNYNISFDDIVVDEEDINKNYEEKLAQIERNIEERKNTKFTVALSLNYEQKGGTYNYDKFNPELDWYASIFIDNNPFYARNWERVEKINDYEYKIYVMYLLGDEMIENIDSFNISLRNNKLVSKADWQNLGSLWYNDCQWFARDYDYDMMKTEKIGIIDLPNSFEVNVSATKVLENSIVIDNPGIKSEFRNITQTVEKVVASPIQTIVKINHSATSQSSNAFQNKYSNPNIEHLPLTREYKVYDANGKELSCTAVSNKNTLIYENGTREDYDYHDIPNKKYNNATWESIEYLIIENTDTDYIKIVPIEIVRNPVKPSDEDKGEIDYEMDEMIVNLK